MKPLKPKCGIRETHGTPERVGVSVFFNVPLGVAAHWSVYKAFNTADKNILLWGEKPTFPIMEWKQRLDCQNSHKWEEIFLSSIRSGTHSKFCFRSYVSPSTILIAAFATQNNEFLSLEDTKESHLCQLTLVSSIYMR